MGKEINDDVLDELLKGCERPEHLLGDGGLMKDPKKALMQRMLGAELTELRNRHRAMYGWPLGKDFVFLVAFGWPRPCSEGRNSIGKIEPRTRLIGGNP